MARDFGDASELSEVTSDYLVRIVDNPNSEYPVEKLIPGTELTPAAGGVSVLDTGGYYTGTNVETVLAELRAGDVAIPDTDLTLTLSVSACVPMSIGTDGLAYGSAGLASNVMVRSSDGFATTETGATLTPTANHSLIYVGRVAEGYVAITCTESLYGSPGGYSAYTNSAQLWFSASWGTGWTAVQTVGRVQGISIGKPVYDPVTAATIWAVGEYSQTVNTAHYVWVSMNGGQTWTQAAAVAPIADTAVNCHMHGVTFDPSTRRVYASRGDAANGWFGYSEDFGVTWTAVPSAGITTTAPVYHQPVIVETCRAGIVSTPDGSVGTMGIWIINRDNHYVTAGYVGAELPADQYAENPTGGNQDVIYAVHPLRGARSSAKVYVTASGDGGRTWHKVYEAAQASTEYYERGIVGPDASGRLFVHCRDNATNKLYTTTTLDWSRFRQGLVRADSGELRAILVAAGAYDSAAAMSIDTNGGNVAAAALTTTSTIVSTGKITGPNLDLTASGAKITLGNGAGVSHLTTASGTTEMRVAVNGTSVFDVTANEVSIRDGKNLKMGTTTGSMVASTSSQKLGFWGATPVVKPTAVADATGAGDVVAQLNALLAKLRTIGIITT